MSDASIDQQSEQRTEGFENKEMESPIPENASPSQVHESIPEPDEFQEKSIPTPVIPENRTKQESHEEKENKSEETKASSKRRKEVNNPFGTVVPQAQKLVYWEDPMYSGQVLGAGLAIVIFTSYVSLFSTLCASVVFSLSANWIYVLGRKQFQVLLNKDDINPYEQYFVEKPWYIERPTAEKYLDVIVDAVNFILQEKQKIVLVDDPMRTLKYVFFFYVAWTISGWFSFHTLLTIALVLGFTLPLGYQRNKQLIDLKLIMAQGIFNSYWERATGLVKHHTKGVVEKGMSLAADKGLIKKEE